VLLSEVIELMHFLPHSIPESCISLDSCISLMTANFCLVALASLKLGSMLGKL